MLKRKIFILLPDGVGLRNFAYSNFYSIGQEKGYDVTFWNNTLFPLHDLGFNEIKIKNAKIHPLTDIYKNVKVQVELTLNVKKSGDSIYNLYRFPLPYSTLKKLLKSIAITGLTYIYSSEKGLVKLRKKIHIKERNTLYYHKSSETLKKERPAIVFCTNQRHTATIAAILAAQDLRIPTATFIFSWDNLPKGTMVVETDYYYVWSLHMKNELLYYYPYIKENQIVVTGTPQFENHFQLDNIIDRELFFNQNNLNLQKKYICYSGDDVTTSPYDPVYLSDLSQAVRELNQKGNNLGIIFRRCPVDFSDRFDMILEKNKDIVTTIDPKWNKIGDDWNMILPTIEDVVLQSNIIRHTEFVVNLGSSMVFDYVSHKKPCAYINYNPINKGNNWSVEKIYKYVHFRSMPKNSVVWFNSPTEIVGKLELMLSDEAQKVVDNAQEWFEKINQHPAQDASKRIWQGIDEICKKEIC